MKRALPILFAALVACSSGDTTRSSEPSLINTPGGDAPPIDHSPLDPAKKPVTSAVSQRMSIAQLRSAFPVILGKDINGDDITWKIGTTPALDKMADVLGEADYVSVTEDNRDPSALYLKFMDDAARDVCNRALVADAARPKAADRVLYRFVENADTATSNAAGVTQNLAYLELRFHGIKVKAGDDTLLAPLRTLFTDAVTAAAAGKSVTSAHVTEGWRAVCVALVTAPEFHLY